jgi:deoxyribodipyrimidine photo-lyase
MKKYNTSIFIFRKDYRLYDNTALIAALKDSKSVIPIFIFTPQQIINNKYKSNNAIQFMIESLTELNNELKQTTNSRLFYFFGEPSKILKQILTNIEIEAVFTNRDYTPYSKNRDEHIKNVCKNNKVDFVQYEDSLLNNVGSVTNTSNQIYVKFTPYFNAAKKLKVREPIKNNYRNYYPGRNKIKGEFTKDIHKFYDYNDKLSVNGGRSLALKVLNSLPKFKTYNKDRNFLDKNTTHLSAYIKFGVVSIREVYHKFKKILGNTNDLIKQLYWRDFYHNIMEYHPNILSDDNKCFKPEYEKVPWTTYNDATIKEKEKWRKWCEGTTGFPIVDAAMRQLNTTGYMHNRGRMIVASFLTKNMFWHFKEGEKYFAQNLVDYDPANNNGGWQWCSSSGVDSMPYFRIFNPWLQSLKYDTDCEYIKKWVPELKDVPNKHIHKWYENYKEYDIYYEPMLDAKETAEKAIVSFKKHLK